MSIFVPEIDMTEKLIELNELMKLMGSFDERTLVKWCAQNRIPIISIGKKKYTVKIFVDLFIKKELEKNLFSQYEDAEKIMRAIEKNDKRGLEDALTEPVAKTVKAPDHPKSNSTAAEDYMKQFSDE
jgi:hypothetical protein